MVRKRRTAKYEKPNAPASPSASAAESAARTLEKKRNPCAHQRQGYRPVSPRRQSKHEKAIFIIIAVVLLTVFVYAATQLVLYFVHSQQAKQEEKMIHELITKSEATTAPTLTAAPSPSPETNASAAPAASQAAPSAMRHAQENTMPDVLIQFHNALAINPDTIGQLKIGEIISTYVVQRDNSHYLRHSFFGEYSFSGAIFLDVSCTIYPQSRNLIIHGHNMQDGTALGKLSRYETVEYLNRFPLIEFSTLYETSRYVPFSVFYYSVNPTSGEYLDMYRVNAMSDQEFMQFVKDVQTRSLYTIPVTVAQDDRILTVTTCATADADIRFAVIAVKRGII